MTATDPYEGKVKLGALVRESCTVAIYDEQAMPDVKRINDILVCEAFINALVNTGCMITRIPSETP